MTDQPRTREELYELIRKSSKDEFIYKEMVRLGFWAASDPSHDIAPELEAKARINKRLKVLRGERSKLGNIDYLIKEARKKRMAESRQRQKETKEKRERERQARAAAWAEKQKSQIIYLGAEVSAGLNNEDTGSKYHKDNGAQKMLASAKDLAEAMALSMSELRFLAFQRKVSKVSHYQRFTIPKKTGGERLISAPKPRLKAAQHWINENILKVVPLHDAAHGFVPGRSIVSNAKVHVGQDVVINLDLSDFFPSVTYRRVKGMFRSFGHSESVATILGLICTEPTIVEVSMDHISYFVTQGERVLPQGAPTSPAITNIICRTMDDRLKDLASEYGFKYSRYADDMSFSGSGEATQKVGKLLKKIRRIVEDEGFDLHPRKTRVQRKGRQQEVTGLVVNERVGVPRKTLKNFRAALYHLSKDGPEGKRWGLCPDIFSAIEGFANFVLMVQPEKGQALKKQVKALRKQHGVKKRTTPKPAAKATKKAAPKEAPAKAAESEPAGILVECYKVGSKIRVRVLSPGYNADWNVQFPRKLRADGARFRVEELKVSGTHYRAVGEITPVVD